MENPERSIARRTVWHRLFWILLPVVIVAALFLVGQQSVASLSCDGQIVNSILPTQGLALTEGVRFGQTFLSPWPNLQRIDVLLYGYFRHNTQPVTFRLREVGGDRDLFSQTFSAGRVWGWRWLSFEFAPLAESAGKEYYMFIESPGAVAGDALSVGGANDVFYSLGSAFVNDTPAVGDGAFKVCFARLSSSQTTQSLGLRLVLGKPSLLGLPGTYIVLALICLLLFAGLLICFYQLRLHDDVPQE